MQTEIEKMTGKISKYMNSITSYTDAVTYRSQNPQILIKDASKVMAKYTKPHHGSNDVTCSKET